MYRILIVDHDEVNLEIAQNCLADFYKVVTATSALEALSMIKKRLPDLILLDTHMPQMNGFEMLSYLKSKNDFKNIPVIFLTVDEGEDELRGLDLGAVDYIKKPFSLSVLKKRIEIHIRLIDQRQQLENYTKQLLDDKNDLTNKVLEKKLSIVKLERAVISIITDLIEGKDGYTGGHVMRTAKYMRIFMWELYRCGMLEGINKKDIDMIALFSKLHDVGKIGIPESILLKTTVLTAAEILQMRLHTIFGSNAIQKSIQLTGENLFLSSTQQMTRSHHEWWDGTGYPDSLAGNKIPLLARIVAICDAYDAIRSQRSYQNERTYDEAMNIIKNSSGTQFDPKLAAVFIKLPLNNC